MTEGNVVFENAGVSTEALATLGEGHIAYVKQIRSEDVPGLFPQAPKIAPGLKLFALHAADGTPIILTDSREAAIANACSNQLQAVSVHCAHAFRTNRVWSGHALPFDGALALSPARCPLTASPVRL